MEVKLEDLISIDDQQRINKENPDDIIINNTTYQIKYSLNCFHEYGRSIEITMKPEDFVLLQS
ncbi:MAG TPA: hypothetical protein P5052_01630 [Candidatus Paceibacterota bacterium]|nr:hypothetical protein [Candidatus Paceibacterota bacterium]HRZ29463.1 hypothetical protein [Candidatus Paceibacterota bacterium]